MNSAFDHLLNRHCYKKMEYEIPELKRCPRDNCRDRVDKYLNNGPLKSLTDIKEFLDHELGCSYQKFINFIGNPTCIYGNESKYFGRHMNRIYFPKSGVMFVCSDVFAESEPYLKNVLSGDWQEQCITFCYYVKTLKTTLLGAKIIILEGEPKSIICKNGQNLEEFLKNNA